MKDEKEREREKNRWSIQFSFLLYRHCQLISYIVVFFVFTKCKLWLFLEGVVDIVWIKIFKFVCVCILHVYIYLNAQQQWYNHPSIKIVPIRIRIFINVEMNDLTNNSLQFINSIIQTKDPIRISMHSMSLINITTITSTTITTATTTTLIVDKKNGEKNTLKLIFFCSLLIRSGKKIIDHNSWESINMIVKF